MKRTVWLEVVLLTTLVGCIPGSQLGTPTQETRPAEDINTKPQQEISTQGIRPEIVLEPESLTSSLSSALLIRAEEGNCPVDEIEISGEGSHVRGSIGGLAIAPNPIDENGVSTPTGDPDPLEMGKQMFDMAEFNINERAAIIVVDDFNGDLDFEQRDNIHAELGLPGVYFLDQQRDRPTLAGLTSGATEAEVEGLEATGQYSHGALVFNHTLALLSVGDTNPEFFSIDVNVSDEAEVVRVLVADFTQLNIVVAALDTEDFNTDLIGGRLQATIQELAEQNIQRFAVNMSFGLVPCSVRDDFRAADSDNQDENQPALTFEEYREAVFAENVGRNDGGLSAQEFRNQLVNILTTPVNLSSDPLLTGAEADPERFAQAAVTDITYLAASGNYALPYSLYPGYWSEFASVSAQNLVDMSTPPVRDPDYSNTGEVLIPGGYYTLTAYDPQIRGWRTYPQISIAGTSFSAPVLSVFTALDFTGATPRCAHIPPSVTSPLAFFKTDPPIATPTPTLDIALTTALDDYCR